MLGRWWAPAAFLGLLLGAAGAGLVWRLFEPEYEALAWLKIDAHPTHLAFKDSGQNSDSFMLTQLEILRSPLIMDTAVQRRELLLLPEIQARSAPAEWLAREIGVRQVGKSELLQVSFEHPDPATSAAIVNGVVDSYMDLQVQQSERHTRHVIQLLEEEKIRRAEELDHLRSKVREIVEKQPELAASGLAGFTLGDPVGDLQNQLIAAEVETEVLRAQQESGRNVSEEEALVAPAAVELVLDQKPQVQRINALLEEKQALLAETRSLSVQGDEIPAIRRLKADVTFYEQELERVRERLRPQAIEEIRRQESLRRQEALAQIDTALAAKQVLVKRLREQLTEKMKGGEGSAGPWSLELQFAQTELTRAEAVFSQIADRAEALSTEVRAPGRVSVLRRATIPTRPVEALPLPKLGAAAAGGFFLPFLLFFLLERRLRRVGQSHQLTRETNLEVIGEIVRLPDRPYRAGAAFPPRVERQRRMFEESIDAIRTQLLLAREWQDLQTLSVASAVSGEGKTRVAAHLAASLARCTGNLVLLIDADLRAPEMHALFETAHDAGLADVLEGKIPLGEAIAPTWNSNLHVLPAGRAAQSPSVLFSGPAFAACLKELRATYRYIIIDAPPVLSASEALVIAKSADSVLMCVMYDISRVPQIKLAYERLLSASANLLGAVLSGVPPRSYERTYGRYEQAAFLASYEPQTLVADDESEDETESLPPSRRPR